MTTKRFLSLFIALAVAIGAVSLGTAVAASPGHHHDDHKPAAKEAAKTKKTRQAAAQQAAAGETVAGLAFGTLEAPRDTAERAPFRWRTPRACRIGRSRRAGRSPWR